MNKNGRAVFFRSCLLSRLCSLPIQPARANLFTAYSLSSTQSPGTVVPRAVFSMGEGAVGGKSEGRISVVHRDATGQCEMHSQKTISSKMDFSISF